MHHPRRWLLPSLALASAACVYDFDAYSVDAGAGGTGPSSSSSSTTSAGGGATSTTTSSAGGGGATGTGGGGTGQGGFGGAGGAGGSECVDDGEGNCEPWVDPLWTKRRRVTIDTTGVAGTLVDFPWLIAIDTTTHDLTAAQATGADLQFVSYDGLSKLSHEVEQWSSSGGRAYVWLKLPALGPATDGPLYVWMYYGNATATNATAEQVWSSGYVSVHHLNASFDDSTANANHGVQNVATSMPAPVADGRIGGAQSFDGVDDHVRLPDEADYDFQTALTVSTWVRVNAWTRNWQAIVTKGDNSWRLHRDNGNTRVGFGTSHGATSNDNLNGSKKVDDGNWRHVAIVYDGAQKRIYVDGELDTQKNYTQTLRNSDVDVSIGENLQATGRYFIGLMDEVRIAGVARSAEWIRFEQLNVVEPQRTTLSAEQSVP